MVIHFKTAGHLACGQHGSNLTFTSELARVKCRSCRNTDVFKEARKDARNASRRAARKSHTVHVATDWRSAWQQRLTDMPGLQRLPRGFKHQAFV